MKAMEIKQLLQRYFEGETTASEEKLLSSYFNGDEVADELKEYSGFFRGLAQLSESAYEENFEDTVMDYIMVHQEEQKTRKLGLWYTLTGIAASVIIVVGGFLFFQQQEQQFQDTFDDPDIAYAYAEQTLLYVSSKYNKGLEALANFEKLNTAAEPLQQGVQPLNQYLYMLEKMNTPDTGQNP